jgi:hypothetical protein
MQEYFLDHHIESGHGKYFQSDHDSVPGYGDGKPFPYLCHDHPADDYHQHPEDHHKSGVKGELSGIYSEPFVRSEGVVNQNESIGKKYGKGYLNDRVSRGNEIVRYAPLQIHPAKLHKVAAVSSGDAVCGTSCAAFFALTGEFLPVFIRFKA